MILGNTIRQFKEALEEYPFSAEAAEDIDVLTARIERVARLVQQSLARPPEHPPVRLDDDESDSYYSFEMGQPERHPLQQAVSDLWVLASQRLSENRKGNCNLIQTYMHGLGDLAGGLAQALMDGETELDPMQRGLAIVQLKRALRGAAFASGALFPLRDMQLLGKDDFDDFHERLDKIRNHATDLLNRFRETGS